MAEVVAMVEQEDQEAALILGRNTILDLMARPIARTIQTLVVFLGHLAPMATPVGMVMMA